jgi:transcription elongation GreA/GreB family factor
MSAMPLVKGTNVVTEDERAEWLARLAEAADAAARRREQRRIDRMTRQR